MTSFAEIECTCALCGEKYKDVQLLSSFSWEGPDLDLRQSPDDRSMLNTELHICPRCGYVQRDVQKAINCEFIEREKKILDTPEYKHPFVGRLNKLATAFVQIAMIDEIEGEEEIYLDYLKAAWSHEYWDSTPQDEKLATELRRESISRLEHKRADLSEDEAYRLIDMLRRTGQFDRVIAKEVPYELGDEKYKQTYEYQIYLSTMKDKEAHSFDELHAPKESQSDDEPWEQPLVDPRIYDPNFKIDVDENDPGSVISNAIADRMEELFSLREKPDYVAGSAEETQLLKEIDDLMEESVKLCSATKTANSSYSKKNESSEIKSIIAELIHGR